MKWIAVPAISILVLAGRAVNMSVIGGFSILETGITSILYGTIAAFLALFLIDLVLAKGLLQRKISCLKILLFLLLAAITTDSIAIHLWKDTRPAILAAGEILIAVVGAILLIRDIRRGDRPDFVQSDTNILPKTYTGAHALRYLLETLFRLFPSPGPLGLYRIGSPRDSSIAFVTGNYSLTVRRAVKALRGTDCWLLVCDSRGINVWCSTLAGHFGTEDIVDAIRFTNLSETAHPVSIVLPQLCAANVSLKTVAMAAGAPAEFGPASINNVEDFIQHEQEIRKVQFRTGNRIEMAFGAPIILTAALLLTYNFIGPIRLLTVIPVVYFFSLLNGLIFPWRPVKNIRFWSLIFGIFTFLTNFVLFHVLWNIMPLVDLLISAVGILYLVNEFEGWSPLVRYSLAGYKIPAVKVISDLCIGCRKCIDVCPKAVYVMRRKKSSVHNVGECILCSSCTAQCPTGAIKIT